MADEFTPAAASLATRKRQLLIWISAGLVLALCLYLYFWYETYHPSTDDAYVQAHVVDIAAQVGGPVTRIYANNNSPVHKNQLLLVIDKRPYEAALLQAMSSYRLAVQQMQANVAAVDIAKANIAKAQADLFVSKQNEQRVAVLVKGGQASLASGDNAVGDYQAAQAALQAAKNQLQQALANLGTPGKENADIQKAIAAVKTARLNVEYTQIRAPADGFITNFEVRIGATVTPQQQLFQFIENKHWFVYANYKETQLEHIRPGQMAKIELDIYPGVDFQGYVDSIGWGSGAAFSLMPPENATGNWVKVTQRFPVKIMIINPPKQYPLRVGASSIVRVNTRVYINPKIKQQYSEMEH